MCRTGHRVAIVQPGRHHRARHRLCVIDWHTAADVTQSSNVKVSCLAYVVDLIVEEQRVVCGHTETLYCSCSGNRNYTGDCDIVSSVVPTVVLRWYR